MALCSFSTLYPKALALASRMVLVGGAARPSAVIAPLRARWTLPHSDWIASAWRLTEALKASHLVAAFSALKEPAPKIESSEGHRPRFFSVVRN